MTGRDTLLYYYLMRHNSRDLLTQSQGVFMKKVVNWMISNIPYYSSDERNLFFKDCENATGKSLRTVQYHYAKYLEPEDCSPHNSKLENNNKDILDQFPNAVPGLLGRSGTPFDDPDAEIVSQNTKLAKRAQKFQDINRIERKSFREGARIVNALDEYNNKLCEVLDKYTLHSDPLPTKEVKIDGETAGIIQLSDLHFNELIELDHNRYDFPTASARLYQYAEKCLQLFDSFGVSHVIIAMTGDMMNSDRRLDELLGAATNRSKATFLAVDILQQFIRHIEREYPVTVTCVSGNESRMSKEMGFTDTLMTDNYDFMIFNILQYLFNGSDCDVTFVKGSDPTEMVINVCGYNILTTHGYNIKTKCEESCTKIQGRYVSRGINIDYIIFGHLHSCRIGDIYARSSSLCGPNAYSERALNLSSKASQNAFIVDSTGINGIRIDLHEVDENNKYDIDSSLEAYNAKSADKINPQNTIFKVVI